MSVLTAPGVGPAVGRRVGTAAGSALALALLACACVFAALAGPALSLHTRTQALQQILAGFPGTTKTVQVNSAWSDFTNSIRGTQALNQDLLSQSTDEIGRGLSAAPVPLAAGRWTALTTKPMLVTAGAARSAYIEAAPKLEVSYRAPFTGYAQLVSGSFSTGKVPPGTIAVTRIVTAPLGVSSCRRLPGCIPNRAAVGTVAATAIVPGGTFPVENDPATSCA